MKNLIVVDNLILENLGDYTIHGNLLVNGDVIIKNTNLNVTGTLTFQKENATISITGGNIIAKDLNSYSSIFIRDGDIDVDYLDLNKNSLSNIDSNRNIRVNKKAWVGHVSCDTFSVFEIMMACKIDACIHLLT